MPFLLGLYLMLANGDANSATGTNYNVTFFTGSGMTLLLHLESSTTSQRTIGAMDWDTRGGLPV